MLTLTPLILCGITACILMMCAVCFKARAAPQLALECEGPRSTTSTGWNGGHAWNGNKDEDKLNGCKDHCGLSDGVDVVARGPARYGSTCSCEPIRCPPPRGGGALVRCPSPPSNTTGVTNGVISHDTGNWSFEAKGRALPGYALFPDAFNSSSRMGKRERDRQEVADQRTISLKVSAQKNCTKPSYADEQYEDDLAGPQLATIKKPNRARRRLYEELVKEFGNSGSRDQALLFKCAIHSRLPGFRKLIDAAFTEASREFFHIN